ncbi:late embryogenis abundant protein 41-like [Zingiber officinale]|uniref:late embryogenis abundant protein 41-like n=1 Tax=Zingiber officinale TaxID=94328 RepID=UPI001C4D14CF|nr:late embryogenis abundant protein 41-like [Zingiber officinale]XP_042385989.1 late embryogenis abundant protein 41-like [Zingiber officinale]
MAPSLSIVNLRASLSFLTARRLCSTSAAAHEGGEAFFRGEWMAKKGKATDDGEVARSWVPDPVTGYYRPANEHGGIDPVDLREMLLKPSKLRT